MLSTFRKEVDFISMLTDDGRRPITNNSNRSSEWQGILFHVISSISILKMMEWNGYFYVDIKLFTSAVKVCVSPRPVMFAEDGIFSFAHCPCITNIHNDSPFQCTGILCGCSGYHHWFFTISFKGMNQYWISLSKYAEFNWKLLRAVILFVYMLPMKNY